MHMVTKCCLAQTDMKHGKEYVDGSLFYISTSWEVCSLCEDEWPDTIEVCEECGEPSCECE